MMDRGKLVVLDRRINTNSSKILWSVPDRQKDEDGEVTQPDHVVRLD